MDHERVNIRTTNMSCGVKELSRINEDSEGVLYQIASSLYHPSRGDPSAIFVYSDVVGDKNSNSHRLSEKVEELGFGTVENTKPAENPKTGNIITVYVWNVDHEPFKKWYSGERVKKLARVGR